MRRLKETMGTGNGRPAHLLLIIATFVTFITPPSFPVAHSFSLPRSFVRQSSHSPKRTRALYTAHHAQGKKKSVESQELSGAKSLKVAKALAVILAVSSIVKALPAVAAVGPLRESTLPPALGVSQLIVGAGMVATVGGIIMSRMGLVSLAKEIMLASLRGSLQLFLLGAVVLQSLLGTTRPSICIGWIAGVGVLGALEALSRVEYTYPKLRRHIILSVISGGLSVLGVSLAGRMFGDLKPWFRPSTLIPVSGMLFGNTLSAVSLAASILTKEFALSRSQLELRLARGATAKEATFPIKKSALSTGLTPTINALAITGIVHMPGMMTGQILAGQSALQASVYQMLILMMITTTACVTVQLLSILITGELMDASTHSWKAEKLTQKSKVKGPLSNPVGSLRRLSTVVLGTNKAMSLTDKSSLEETRKTRKAHVIELAERHGVTGSPVFKADTVRVERAGVEFSFTLHDGERIGVTGSSGIGKSQLLRTLVGLERCYGNLDLNGVSPGKKGADTKSICWPEWRRRVSLVSQDRPTMDETPRQFFDELREYHSRKGKECGNPIEIAKKWHLDPILFDKKFCVLSGGEAQRVSLSIALSLGPEVLLLDEATSGLDLETALLVEDSLKKSGIPIIMVTHSKEQLHRFCSHHIDLNHKQDFQRTQISE